MKKVCAILFLGLLLGGDVLANHFSYKVPEIKVKEFDRWMGKLKRKDGKWFFKSPKKFKKLDIDKSEIPTDIQVMINNKEMGAALLRIVEVIGQDEIERIDEDTIYFIISTLNQLNIDIIRNKILMKVLPLKV